MKFWFPRYQDILKKTKITLTNCLMMCPPIKVQTPPPSLAIIIIIKQETITDVASIKPIALNLSSLCNMLSGTIRNEPIINKRAID